MINTNLYSLKIFFTNILTTIKNLLNETYTSIILYYSNIFFYILVFSPAINKLGPKIQGNYFTFILPGLVIFALLAGISHLSLSISLNMQLKVFHYWFSFPVSISGLVQNYCFESIIIGFFYSIPLLFLMLFLGLLTFQNLLFFIILIASSSTFFFLILLIFIIYLVNTPFFSIIYQTIHPLLTRLAPIYYPIMALPTIILPIVFFNPVTYLISAFRDPSLLLYVIIISIILDFVLFKLTVTLWIQRFERGEI